MFAELLGRSCFSFLHGASQPEEMVEQAHSLGLAALALCDRDGLYGSVRAHVKARELSQRVIVGAELPIRFDLATTPQHREGCREHLSGGDSLHHPLQPSSKLASPVAPGLVLLVENQEGYRNLCQLLTRSHANSPKGQSLTDLDWLSAHYRGLFAIIPAPEAAARPWPPKAIAMVLEIFGERAVLALHKHLDGFDRKRERAAVLCAKRYGMPIIASARPLYHRAARKSLADVLHCIRTGTTLDRAGSTLALNFQAFLRSEEQVRRLFPEHPAWIDFTGEIAQTLRFELNELRYRFPCELLPHETADTKLARLTYEGARNRYPQGIPAAVERQLEKELELIAHLGVAPYFLSTWEIVELARRRRILCQGRGSAANSAVCYALGITAVDPARSNLLFERFMSQERAEPPDIDVDFEHERREEVIQEIYERYGRDRAAMVSEVITYRSRSALREVAKVFGLSLEQADRLSKLLGYEEHFAPTPPEVPEPGKKGAIRHGTSRAGNNVATSKSPLPSMETSPALHSPGHSSPPPSTESLLREAGFDPNDARIRQVLALSRQLQGFPRHLSVHVGGFVLSSAPLWEVAPVEPARMINRTVIPWDKDDLEELGFFKVDVLGLGMLTAIRKCLSMIWQDGGLRGESSWETEATDPPTGVHDSREGRQFEDFDPVEVLTRIPAEDPQVYELVSRADTIGVFQVESRAQMSMLPRLKPAKFYDLVIEVALVRPGPIQGGMVHPYLRRRNGQEEVRSPHPDLTPILERTLGVPLFQEQVMQLAIVGAGYTGGEADQLRRDMAAWKRSGKLLQHRQRLLDGFARKGIVPEFGEALFEQIKGFGDYGFPESHAASFALLVYASAWQKAHYPAHFACALLNAQPMGFYSPSSIVQDAQRHGVEVRDVTVVHSNWDSILEGSFEGRKALRLGLRLIKGLGESCGLRIEKARRERPFESVQDTVRRAQLEKHEIAALAESGALEPLAPGRRQALWQLRAPRLEGLFAGLSVKEPAVKLPPMLPGEQLALDYGRKGLSVDDHPLRQLRPRLKRLHVVPARELVTARQGSLVRVAGLVTCRQRPGTASGVVFLTLEDETGYINCVIWRDVFTAHRQAARNAKLLLVTGRVERDQGSIEPTQGPGVIHVIAQTLARIDVPGCGLWSNLSRDFH